MASSQETTTVKIEGILRDKRYQVRNHLNPQTIERYACSYSTGVAMPPVRIARANDALILVDGFHRIEALNLIGEHYVEAQIVETTEREAVWLAAESNLTHGLPLKNSELRSVFRAYVKARKHYDKNGELKSYRTIALELGGLRAYTTIRNWMKKDFPKIARRYGHDENFSGKGGLQETAFIDEMLIQTHEAIDKAAASFHGVKAETDKGEIISRIEGLLETMKSDGSWRYPDF